MLAQYSLLTFEMLQNLILKLENVLAFVLFLHFEGHVATHLLVKRLIDITYQSENKNRVSKRNFRIRFQRYQFPSGKRNDSFEIILATLIANIIFFSIIIKYCNCIRKASVNYSSRF